MADPVRGTPAVGSAGGFAPRTPDRRPGRSGQHTADGPRPPGDDVAVAASAATIARRLLRERVLARTRALFALRDHDHGPVFAEVIDDEPAHEFVGRLLSAQNQLVARSVAALPATVARERLDRALRDGVQETLDLLAAEPLHQDGVAVVATIVAEYARRLAAHAHR